MTLAEQITLMRSGRMYNDLTPELVAARGECSRTITDYNASVGRHSFERESILRSILGSIGERVHFEPTFYREFGFNIRIGNNFYANVDCILLDGGGIEIGDDVLLGPRVGIYTTNHAIDPVQRAQGARKSRPVSVGDKVWIGAGVHINPGVSIGEGSVIGAGSVVTADIPPGVIAAGVPCRVLRDITAADQTDYQPIIAASMQTVLR
jgi:maltose O-acetyltransferase